MLPVGQRVMVKDLVGAKQYNGRAGRVLSLDEETGRCVVLFTIDGTKKALKPANLDVLVSDEAAQRAIIEAEPTMMAKLNEMLRSEDLGFADLDDPAMCGLLRRLLRAGYWADRPDTMDELIQDLELAEHPSAPEAIGLIRQLMTSSETSKTLDDVGARVHADEGLRHVFDRLKARGHDFDF